MMNTCEIYDDIDCEYIEQEISKEDSVSEYCIAIFDATNQKPIGSGIIIDSNGHFITAAHNFKKEKCMIKAFFDGQVYEIETLYIEYERGARDLFIGKLVQFNSDKYQGCSFPKLDDIVQLKVDDELCVAGYKGVKLRGTDNLGVINPIGNLHLTKQRFNSNVTKPDAVQKMLQNDLECPITFFLEREGAEKYKGFSGGPVYSDGKILGIVISHYFLNADYIKLAFDKLCKNAK